jgi:hypothetical protein
LHQGDRRRNAICVPVFIWWPQENGGASHGQAEEVAREGQDRLDVPAGSPVHEGRRDDRPCDGSKKVSAKGLGSGVRMVQFYINRAGKSLPEDRKRELERAKELLRSKARSARAKREEKD